MVHTPQFFEDRQIIIEHPNSQQLVPCCRLVDRIQGCANVQEHNDRRLFPWHASCVTVVEEVCPIGIGNHNPENWSGLELHEVPLSHVW